jgi:hypothetical protein
MNETILVCVLSGSFGLLGVVIGIWSTSAVAARTARIEERKHFRELGLKVALTKFEGCSKLAQQLANSTGRFQEIPPFEAFVIEGIKFMDIVSTPGLSANETARRMSELREFSKTIVHAAKQKQQNDA